MNETFDPITLLIMAAAVIVFFKLRGVLGQKTGHQKPLDPFSQNQKSDQRQREKGDDAKDKEESNVVPLPGTEQKTARKKQPVPEKPAWADKAKDDSDLAKSLRKIKSVDNSFDADQFVDGAKAAYEMIVTAFAQGDKKMLKSLLSKEVLSGFVTAIDDRKAQGVEMTTQFIGIEKSEIVSAELDGKKAFVTINIVSELVSVVHDKSGEVVEGDATQIQEITDVWTFERDLSSRDPNWRLVATDADEG